MKKVIIVGGGASGLMAAYAAAKGNAEVLLFEKNEKLGKKIYITGKGRCNLTNDCPPDEFLSHVVHGGKFLTGAIWSFTPQNMMSLLIDHGLQLKTERGNRVFPITDHASDVTKTLEKMCRGAGVTIKLNENVEKLDVLQSTVSEIITDKSVYKCDAAVIATGGLSYPSTGSTGDGYRFAKECGHSVHDCAPSLVGLDLIGDFSSVQGISLKNVVLTAARGEKIVSSRMGELLFTHYGIGGPLALSLSAEINRLPLREIRLSLDFKPALDEEKLNARLLRDFSERKNEQMKNVIRGLLPSSLGLLILKESGISLEKQANAVTKEERTRLVGTLKQFPLKLSALRGFDEAVVTSGGVSLKEIDPKTMESRLVKGLYFCGETLDIDAYTGGFNLQIAFSTGFAAGRASALT